MVIDSAAVRSWVIVAAASLRNCRRNSGEFAGAYSTWRGAAPATAAADAGAVRKALQSLGRTARCGDSQTRRSIPTRGGEFTMPSVRNRLWSRREKQ